MRELIVLRAGGRHDEQSLDRIQALAAAAAQACDDPRCTDAAQAIAYLAAELFSDTAHEKWAQGKTAGADVLRLRILREIDAVQDRIAAIEALRDGAEQQGSAPGIRALKPR